jgi:hypothetical protein
VGSVEHRLDEDRIVGVTKRDQLVALVGKRGPGLLEVRRDLARPVEDIPGRDELVARVVEGLEGDVELMPVLRLHVLDHDRFALLAEGLGGRHDATLSSGARRYFST